MISRDKEAAAPNSCVTSEYLVLYGARKQDLAQAVRQEAWNPDKRKRSHHNREARRHDNAESGKHSKQLCLPLFSAQVSHLQDNLITYPFQACCKESDEYSIATADGVTYSDWLMRWCGRRPSTARMKGDTANRRRKRTRIIWSRERPHFIPGTGSEYARRGHVH